MVIFQGLGVKVMEEEKELSWPGQRHEPGSSPQLELNEEIASPIQGTSRDAEVYRLISVRMANFGYNHKQTSRNL